MSLELKERIFTKMKPPKTPLERELFAKWFPVFISRKKVTPEQIIQYKNDLKMLEL